MTPLERRSPQDHGGSHDRLVGRQAEMAAVDRFLDRVPSGPVGLVLSGEPGIGKTGIWLEAIHRAAVRGHRILQARPAEREQQLSFAGLGDLLRDTFPDVGGSLPEPQREALLGALLQARTTAPVDPRTTATAVTSVLATLAAERPLVLAIDDVQWLDRASERALEFAMRRLPDRAGVVIAIRAVDPPSPLGLDAALAPDALVHVPVGGLPVEALRDVIAAAGLAPSRSTLARLASTSGGNPLYALELARALGDADARPGEPLPVPPILANLVRDRTERLSPAAHAVATAAAALFRPTQALIGAAVEPGLDVDAAIIEAEEAGIIDWDGDRLRFTHPLLGSALYGSLSTGRRRALHRRLATVVAEPEERAHHLARGTIGPDGDAAHAIEEAAVLAERRGAADAAADLYRIADRLTPPGDNGSRARRRLGAANAMATAGDLPAARRLADDVLSIAAAGPLRARALLLEGSLAAYAGASGEQAPALDAALAEARGDRVLQVEVLLARSGLIGLDPEGAARSAEEAVLLSREIGDAAMLARAVVNLVMASAILGRGARPELLDEVAVLEAAAPSWGVNSLIWSHWVDDVAGVRERFATQQRIARERGDAFGEAELAEFIAMTDFRCGDWETAERLLEDACATLDPIGPIIASFADRSVIDAHRGRLDRARRTLADILARDPPPDRFWVAVCLSARGAVEFVGNDVRAADAAWTRMGETIQSLGWLDFLEDRSEPDHVEALLVLGDRRRARDVLDHLEWRGRTLPRPWIDATAPRARALLAAADGDLDQAIAAIDAAPSVPSLPFERARLLLVKGQIERRANRKLTARQSLDAALVTFEQLGSPPWVDRTREEIGRLGLRHRDRHELTAMERRIAELAATGLTNRQVADAAFVSPKTVEANLARVYGKLGIRSRAELGAWMVAHSPRIDLET